MTDSTEELIHALLILQRIVEAWSEDANHDVPYALIEEARAVLRPYQ
jgi:hypothetical protein